MSNIEVLAEFTNGGGRDEERKSAATLLVIGQEYKITETDLGPFSSYVKVEGFDHWFNLCAFNVDFKTLREFEKQEFGR